MKVIIVDSATDLIDAGERPQLLDWARDLGVDINRATPRFVLTPAEAGGAIAHFSLKRQRDGHDYVLPNTNRVAVDFAAFAVEVPQGSWPRWFGESVDVPDMPIATLLEVLAVADEARSNMASALWRYRDATPAVAL